MRLATSVLKGQTLHGHRRKGAQLHGCTHCLDVRWGYEKRTADVHLRVCSCELNDGHGTEAMRDQDRRDSTGKDHGVQPRNPITR